MKAVAYNAAKHVQKSKDDWRGFLRFYAGFYKYPFSEALLIYEQTPNATACGEIRHWNRVGRFVHKGTKGTPVINDTDRSMKIRYVFDIMDTYGADRGIPRHWDLPEKYKEAVLSALQKDNLSALPTTDYNKNLKWAIEKITQNRCSEYLEGIRYDLRNSRLERHDLDGIHKAFTDTVIDSVGYLTCERLGIDKGLYDNDSIAFEYLSDFNTRAAMSRLGRAAGDISRGVLTLIAETIRKEQEKERMSGHDGRRRVHNQGSDGSIVADGGGNRSNGERTGGTAASDGQVRTPVLELPGGEPPLPVHAAHAGDGYAGSVRSGQQGSERDAGYDNGQPPETDAAPEGRLYEDMAIRNVDKGSGGRNSVERYRLQNQVTDTTAGDESPSPFYLNHPHWTLFLVNTRRLPPNSLNWTGCIKTPVIVTTGILRGKNVKSPSITRSTLLEHTPLILSALTMRYPIFEMNLLDTYSKAHTLRC